MRRVRGKVKCLRISLDCRLKRGVNKKYGDKLNYAHIPSHYLKETTLADGIKTNIYQMPMWHKLFPDLLNVIIIVKFNLNTQAWSHVVLAAIWS